MGEMNDIIFSLIEEHENSEIAKFQVLNHRTNCNLRRKIISLIQIHINEEFIDENVDFN